MMGFAGLPSGVIPVIIQNDIDLESFQHYRSLKALAIRFREIMRSLIPCKVEYNSENIIKVQRFSLLLFLQCSGLGFH